MARRTFFSFHYKPDNWRASTVRQIGSLEGNRPVSDNDWETVAGAGDAAISRWIDGQLAGRSCTIVLAGSQTAGRKWINYEIKKSWESGKGVFVVYIHNLKDKDQKTSAKGANPLASLSLDGTSLSSIAKAYDPPGATSGAVYNHIAANLAAWADEAVAIRSRYPK